MDRVAAVQRRIIARAAALAMVLAILAALSGRWPAALGVLAGCLVAVLNFRLLALSVIRLLNLSPRAAQVQAAIRYFIRYGLTILVLLSVNANPNMDVYATFVGLLLIKVVILSEAVWTFLKQQAMLYLNPARWERGEK